MSKVTGLKGLLALLVLMFTVAGGSARAATVRVRVGQTVKVALPRQPKIIGVEDPAIASIKVTDDGKALVRGLKAGRTRIIGRDFAELPFIIPVVVTQR